MISCHISNRHNIYFGLQETSSIGKCRELEAGGMTDARYHNGQLSLGTVRVRGCHTFVRDVSILSLEQMHSRKGKKSQSAQHT
jgi:hypothetical protein